MSDKKSFSDIKEEVSSYIDDIGSEKQSVEQELRNLYVNIEDSFENAQNQIGQINSEISRDEIELEKLIQSRLEIASSSVANSIESLSTANKEIKYRYNQLVLPVSLLLGCIFLISLFGHIVNLLPFLGMGIMGISFLHLIIFIIVVYSLFLMWKSYQLVENSFDNSFEALNNNKTLISQQNWGINRKKVHEQKFTSTKPFFVQARKVTDTLIVNVAKSVPFISHTFNELTLLTRYRTLVENFRIALNYYGLCKDPAFFNELKQFAPADVQIIGDEDVWEKSIVGEIITQLEHEGINVSQNLILLLFYEHNGQNTRKIFRQVLNSDEDLSALSKILINNRIIVDPPSYYQYRIDDIIKILKSTDAFDLTEINRIVSNKIRQMDYIYSYMEFLVKNGINLHFKPTLQYIIEQNVQTDDFATQVIDLAYKICFDALGDLYPLSEGYRHGFANASLSLKFNNELSMRAYACQRSADDITTSIIRAYYEKSNEFNRAEPVLLIELIQDIKLIESEYSKRNSDDFKFLKSELNEGKWFDSSGSYLKKFIETSTEEIKEKISKIEKFSILEDVLKDNFQSADINSIEKAIDAQIFGAYLIMFDSRCGNLKDLVDLLSIRDLESDSEKRWESKPSRRIEEIERKYGVTPKYDFINFSRSTRIGVLKEHETFSDFEKSLLKDLKKLLHVSHPESNCEKYDIGLVIHKITLSKYCFGLLDDDEISDIVAIKNLNLGTYISKLASDNISPEKLASVLRFEEKIDLFKTINYKSIYDIVRFENDDLVSKEKSILASNKLKDDILNQLEENLGANGFRALALDLNKRFSKKQVSEVVEDVLYGWFLQEPGLKRKAKVRAKVLSERFADSFEKLSLLYALQKH